MVPGITLQALLLAVVAATFLGGTSGQGQSRPAGEAKRVWLEGGVEAAAERQGCDCPRQGAWATGPAATVAVGVTLPRRLGLGVSARRFREIDFEYGQRSTYYLALIQYSLSERTTVVLGGGKGSHAGVTLPTANNGDSRVVYGALSYRLRPASLSSAVLSASMTQALSGSRAASHTSTGVRFQPMLLLFGASVNFASGTPTH